MNRDKNGEADGMNLEVESKDEVMCSVAVPPTLHVMFIFDSYSTVTIGCCVIGLEYMLRIAVSRSGCRGCRRSSTVCAESRCRIVSSQLSLRPVCVESLRTAVVSNTRRQSATIVVM